MRTAIFILIALPVLGSEWLAVRFGAVVGAGTSFPLSFLVLAGAAGLIGALGLGPARRGGAEMSRGGVALDATSLLACLLAPSLARSEVPLAFLLFALLGFRLLRSGPLDHRAAAVAVGLDFLIEAIAVHQGSYSYRNALASPLPLWLPAMWANLGIAVQRLYRHMAPRERAPISSLDG